MTCVLSAVGTAGVVRWRVAVLVTVRHVAMERLLLGCLSKGIQVLILWKESFVGW